MFGEAVRAYRRRLGLSQEDLAGRAGVDVKTIGNIEAGRTTPRPSTMRLLADALELRGAERDRFYQAPPAESGAMAASTASAGRPTVLAQLPAAVAGFAGRTEQLAALDALVRADRPPSAVVISALSGTAGVGKSALAVHWAHSAAHRFPDGQLFVNLRGFDPTGAAVEPAVAIRGFLDALGVPPQRVPSGLAAQAALYRSELAGKRVLVVLDNARSAEQVRPLLPGSPGCLVLVTSRDRLASLVATEAAQPVPLDLLSYGESCDLLTRRLGAERTAAEPEAVEDIITRCARLPLALAVVAALAATRPNRRLAELAGDLCDRRIRLDPLGTSEPATDLRAVFACSYHAVSAPAARLFRLLGLRPGTDISVSAAASLAGMPVAVVRPLLAELARTHLLTEPRPGRYTCHDLLHAYATELGEQIDTDAERWAARRRITDHYVHASLAAAALLDPHRIPIELPPPEPGVTVEDPADYDAALRWYAAEHGTLLTAIRQLADIGLDADIVRLSWTIADYLDLRGHWHDQIASQTAARAAAGRMGDRRSQAVADYRIARAYIRLGSYDDALGHLEHALDVHQTLGDLPGQAQSHFGLARVFELRGDLKRALRHAEEALDLYRTAGHRDGQAIGLNSTGWYHALLGNYEQALGFCQQALALLHDLGDRRGQAATWDSLGYAHHHLGHHTDAIACYQEALALFQEFGERYVQTQILTHLGETHLALGNRPAARTMWQQALAILQELGHSDTDEVTIKLHRLDQDPDPITP